MFRGRTARSLGSWNSHFPAVYVLGFSGLTRPGSFRPVDAAGRRRCRRIRDGSPPRSSTGSC